MLHAPTEHRNLPDLVGALNAARYATQSGLVAAGRLVRLWLSARDGVPAPLRGTTARPATAPLHVAMANYASRRIQIRHLVPAARPRPAAELLSGATTGGLT